MLDHVPYDKPPKGVSVGAHISREVNGSIYIWHHCDEREPEWEVRTVITLIVILYSFLHPISLKVTSNFAIAFPRVVEPTNVDHAHISSDGFSV